MAHEEGKRAGLAVFLPHEQHGREGTEQDRSGCQLALCEVHRRIESVALGTIADVVVVGAEHHESGRVVVADDRSVAPLVVSGVLAGVNETVDQRLGQVRCTVEVLVVLLLFAGQRHAERMVEIVVPLHVEPVTGLAGRSQGSFVVGGCLGDQENLPVEGFGGSVHLVGVLGQERSHRRVDDGVDGIEPESVDVMISNEGDRRVDEVPAHLVAAGAVEVQRRTPRRANTDR